jgi:hypothetical protein
MLKIPGADQFGGHSDIPDKVKQTDWLNAMKNNGCIGCHQLGNLATRTLPKGLGEFKTSEEAWARRVQSGQAGPLMVNLIAGDLASTPIKYFAEWTDRIAEGELPKNKPQRPQGTTSIICTTRFRPTSVTRRSTATARCSARRNTPPISFRSSIR